MGREAYCRCQWGETSGEAKVLLEALELIVRKPVQRRVLISDLADVRVAGEQLLFQMNGERVALALGAA